MPGFTTYADLKAEIEAGKTFTYEFHKVSTAPEVTGGWHSIWRVANRPAAGADPAGTPGAAYTDSAGSMFFPNVSTDQKYLISMGGVASQACTLMLYDRLVGVGGISVASTGNKTINSAALPRYTDGVDVQVWLEVSTATTTTAPVVNLNSYTANDAVGAGRTGGSITFPAAATNVDSLIGPMPLQVGDKGVKSVEVGLNVGTAASAGVVSVILIKPLAYLNLFQHTWAELDYVLNMSVFPRVYDGASLALAMWAGTTSATTVMGQIRIAYG